MRTNLIASFSVIVLTLNACASNLTPAPLPPAATTAALITTVIAPTSAVTPTDKPQPTATPLPPTPTLAPTAPPKPSAVPKLDMRKVNWLQAIANEPLLVIDKTQPQLPASPDAPFVKEKNKPDGEGAYGYVYAQDVAYGDFSGDGQEEAVFNLVSGGTAGNTGVLVFNVGPDGKPNLATALAGYKLNGQIVKGELIVGYPQYAGWEGNCCPSASVTTRYQLKDNKLVELGKKVEPFTQAREATVRQFYSWLEDKNYKAAYAFLQPAMQKLLPLEQFTAGQKEILARDVRSIVPVPQKNLMQAVVSEAHLDKNTVKWYTDGLSWDLQWSDSAKQWLMAFSGSAGGLKQTFGTVTGALAYPSEGIPPLTIYARSLESGALISQKTVRNQRSYSMTLPAGGYEIFAYPIGITGTIGGGYSTYSQCVVAGKPDICKKHGEWAVVNVSVGQTTSKINIDDWYADPKVLPAQPGVKETELLLRGKATQVMMALQANNGAALAALAHPTKGVRFSPYATTKPQDIVLTTTQLKTAYADKTVRKWGMSDGIGEPINLTFAAYAQKFIYEVDFLNAPNSAYNKRLGNGNSIHNLPQFYPNSVFVEHYFPDPTGDGIQWRSLRLVFQLEKGEWVLVGIAHDQWTI